MLAFGELPRSTILPWCARPAAPRAGVPVRRELVAAATALLLAAAACAPAFVSLDAPAAGPRAGSGPAALRTGAPSTPFEEDVLADAEDGFLEKYDLLDVGLAASSATAAERAAARSSWEGFLARAGPALAAERSEAARGRLLLRKLHEELLRSYVSGQNDLRLLLREGSYNCVSSAVVYVAAAQRLGLPAGGMILPSHAYARVVADGKERGVETTTPGGFDPDRNNPAFRQHLATVAPSEPGSEGEYRLPVDALTLVSFLYMNRGSVAAGEGRPGEAIAYLERARRVATDDTRARRYRDSALASVSAQRIKAQDLAGGIALIETALAPPAPSGRTGEVLRKNLVAATERAAEAGDFSLAERGLALSRASGTAKTEVERASGIVEMYRGIFESKAGHHEEAAAAARLSLVRSGHDRAAVANLLFVFQRFIHARLDAKDLAGGVKLGREVVALLPGDAGAARLLGFALAQSGAAAVERDPAAAERFYAEALRLDPQSASIRRNLAVTIARSAGRLYDRRDFAGAIREWERALAVEPGLDEARTNIDVARQASKR